MQISHTQVIFHHQSYLKIYLHFLRAVNTLRLLILGVSYILTQEAGIVDSDVIQVRTHPRKIHPTKCMVKQRMVIHQSWIYMKNGRLIEFSQ